MRFLRVHHPWWSFNEHLRFPLFLSLSLSFSLLFLFSPPSTCSRKLIFQRTKWPTLILVTNLKSVGAKSPFKDHRDFTMRERTGEAFKGGKKKTDGEWLKDQSDWDTHTQRERERGFEASTTLREDLNFHFLPSNPRATSLFPAAGPFLPLSAVKLFSFIDSLLTRQGRSLARNFSRNETFVPLFCDERCIEEGTVLECFNNSCLWIATTLCKKPWNIGRRNRVYYSKRTIFISPPVEL